MRDVLSSLCLPPGRLLHYDADHVPVMVSGSPPTFLSFIVKTSLVDIIRSAHSPKLSQTCQEVSTIQYK